MAEEEILAVFAHELAHAKRRHLPKITIAAILWTCGLQSMLFLIGFTDYFFRLDESIGAWLQFPLGMANMMAGMLFVLFPLSRRHEHEADTTAARWVGVGLYKRALFHLYQLNDQLNNNLGSLKRSNRFLGTHPSLQNRLDRVSELEA